MLKGIFSGLGSLVIAIIQGEAIPGFACITAALKMIKAKRPTTRSWNIFWQKMKKVPGYVD
ncbi:hypothetical protein [Shuttleworthella satelles]|uniref:Uncharacterized protein n=1 Tax=Shuttleworthella satelles DSM 14600 TaxID=626523 RepID=C4GC96_9FIRM|nr:hypothetical protein [Shuttleworthia satelles]EEP28038.1 hypothetical protein GCWU000342_01584 [Shuttleworthia satelles DSM 14600]